MKGKMYLNRVLALALCLVLLLTAAGCGQQEEDASSLSDSSASSAGSSQPETQEASEFVTGRFVESPGNLPDDSGYLWELDLVGDDLYLFGSKGRWKSSDGGETWQDAPLESALVDEMTADGFDLFRCAYGKDGTTVLGLSRFVQYGDGNMDFYNEGRYVVIEPDGSERELEIRLPAKELSNMPGVSLDDRAEPPAEYATEFTAFEILSDGSLLGKVMSNNLYHIDIETGEILHTLEWEEDNQGWFQGFGATSTCLLVAWESKIRLFDLETWEERDDAAAVNDYLIGDNEVNADGQIVYTGSEEMRRYFHVFADSDEAFYFFESSGVYRYMPGGVTVEKLIEPTVTSIGMQNINCHSFVETPDHTFYALFIEGGGDTDVSYSFFRYSFDRDAQLKPSQEMTIAGMYPMEAILQPIAVFQKNHDVLVTYEPFIDWGSGSSSHADTADSIRKLNTEIMADKGPDILILDGMNVENYRDKGMLLDITDVVEEVAAENDLLRNITDIYQQDGRLFAVPCRCDFAIVAGEKANLDKITGMESLTKTVQELRAADKEVETITGSQMPGQVMNMTIGMLSPDWLKDGVVNWDIIGDYYDQVKAIHEANVASGKDAIFVDEDGVYHAAGPLYEPWNLGWGFVQKEAVLEMRFLSDLKGLTSLYGLQEDYPDLDYKLLEDNGVCGFHPDWIVAINARSKHVDQAKEFIKLMLEQEIQQYITVGNGPGSGVLPVNFDVIRAYFAGQEGATYTETDFTVTDPITMDGETVEKTRRNPTVEEINQLRANMEKLNQEVINQDSVVNTALMTNCYDYAMGDATKEEALQAAREQLELYLAES